MLLLLGDNFAGALGGGRADDVVSLVATSSAIHALLLGDSVAGFLSADGCLTFWGAGDCVAANTTTGVLTAAVGGARCAFVERANPCVVSFSRAPGHAPLPHDLNSRPVISLAVGARVALALVSGGSVFEFTSSACAPRSIDAHLPRAAVRVACGDGHCAVVDSAACAYTWGDNFYGQCAVTGGGDATIARPVRVDAFDGIPLDTPLSAGTCDAARGVISAVACGAWSTAFLTTGGDVYTTATFDDGDAKDSPLRRAHDARAVQSFAAIGGGDALGVGGGTRKSSLSITDGLPSDVIGVAAGARHYVATTQSGEAWVWGVDALPARVTPTAASIGPPVSGSRPVDASAAQVERTLGAIDGWGLVRLAAAPTRVPVEELTRGGGERSGRAGDGAVLRRVVRAVAGRRNTALEIV